MNFKGEHTRRVILEKREVTYNEYNEEIEVWKSYKELFAEFYARQAKEGVVEGQNIVVQDKRCKIRYVDGLNEADFRIKDGGTIYDITSIIPAGRRKELRLMLEKRDNESS